MQCEMLVSFAHFQMPKYFQKFLHISCTGHIPISHFES